MIITVERYLSTAEATLSSISVNGDFECWGLEDAFHPRKLAGETRIPAGGYAVHERAFGGFYERYKKDRRFRSFHEGMLWIKDVPGFSDILIHCGNTHRDTEGCLLVARERDELSMTLRNSTDAYIRLYKTAIGAAKAKALTIDFQDKDR